MIHIILSVRIGPWQIQFGRRWPASEVTVWKWSWGMLRVLKWKSEGDEETDYEKVLKHYTALRDDLRSGHHGAARGGVRDDIA